EVLLRRRVGEQPILGIPTLAPDRLRSPLRSGAIGLRQMLIAVCLFEFLPISKSFDHLQSNDGGAPVFVLRRHAAGEILAPIDKWPPWQFLQQTIGSLMP